MKNTIRKKPEIRKREIIDVALSLFLELGYENVTMNEIAVNSGVAKGLCYHYFPSKEELYNTALSDFVEGLTQEFLAVIRNREMSIKLRMNKMSSILSSHKGETLFYDFSRQQQNNDVYVEMLRKLFNNLIPYLTEEYMYSKELNKKLKPRIETLMNFLLYGQLNVLAKKERNFESQLAQINEYLDVLLQYENEIRGV